MTQKKPITDSGVILYKDYEFLFNMLTNEELGETIRHIMKNTFNPTLNPSTNKNVNNVFNYIANRIIDYRNKNVFYRESGKKGGNPNLLKTYTLNPTLNPTLKLSKDKISKDKISKDKISKDSIEEPIGEVITSPQGNDSKPVKSKDARYIELENLFKEKLELKLNKSLQSNKWYDDIRKLIEIDKISIDRVKSSILWHFDNYDRDYRLEIQSASSLREKFSKLESQKTKFEQNNKPQMSDKTKEFFDKYKKGE